MIRDQIWKRPRVVVLTLNTLGGSLLIILKNVAKFQVIARALK